MLVNCGIINENNAIISNKIKQMWTDRQGDNLIWIKYKRLPESLNYSNEQIQKYFSIFFISK